jgi:patatin-like phospholipase/acyl hydrolase
VLITHIVKKFLSKFEQLSSAHRQAQQMSQRKIMTTAQAMNQPVKILAIDGGGIRGIIPAMLLAHIESLTGRPIAHLFDLVAGTSTGGILALGLTIPKTAGAPLYTAQQFVEMYEREGPRIFFCSLWRRIVACGNLREEKYSAAGIEAVLAEYFGDARLRGAVTDVLVTSYEIEQNFPFFFKSSNARERLDYDFPACLGARATSAAPTYFEPMKLPAGTNTDHYTLHRWRCLRQQSRRLRSGGSQDYSSRGRRFSSRFAGHRHPEP